MMAMRRLEAAVIGRVDIAKAEEWMQSLERANNSRDKLQRAAESMRTRNDQLQDDHAASVAKAKLSRDVRHFCDRTSYSQIH